MQERRLKLGIVGFPYSGSGGGNAETSDIRNWLIPTLMKAKSDPRIEEDIWHKDYNDTPVTMMRNRAVVDARQAGVDVLVMIDADMQPDCEYGYDPEAKPFFDTSFDFIYGNWDKGPHVVCAPYCGPPPDECVYVFHWKTNESGGQNVSHSLQMYEREHAATLKGIQPCAAQPTGLIMWDMRAFDLTDPKPQYDEFVRNGMEESEARNRVKPWFYYEHGDIWQSHKDSTEDVTATRDISMHGLLHLGYSPIYCNWDAWAGHHKAKVVRKPRIIFADLVGEKYRQAAIAKTSTRKREMYIESDIKPIPKVKIDQTPRGAKPDLVRIGDMFTPKNDLEGLRRLSAAVTQDSKESNPLYVEVGSWIGESAIALAEGSPHALILCVDTWEGSPSDRTRDLSKDAGTDAVFEAFKKNTKGYNIAPLRKSSLDVAKNGAWANQDLIHIDADHEYESVKSDILAWWPHLKDGGVMSFHDYLTAGFPGVTRALRECFGDRVHHIPNTSIGWVKKDDATKGEIERCQQAVPRGNEGAD